MAYITLENTTDSLLSILIGMVVSVILMAGNTHASGGFVLKTADYSKHK